jgi:hypothetical protein
VGGQKCGKSAEKCGLEEDCPIHFLGGSLVKLGCVSCAMVLKTIYLKACCVCRLVP